MARTALIQVLGAVAYGEQKAYEKARLHAEEAANAAERRQWLTIAAEELRHHKGFVRRLRAIGADPERAMRPYRTSLDHFHAELPDEDDIAEAVCAVLGEGIASDLLAWLRTVVDTETAEFIDTVIADEVGHEERATRQVLELIDHAPQGRARAAGGAARMLRRMATSGQASGPSFVAFVRLGRAPALVAGLAAGFVRRLHQLGIGPVSTLERIDPFGILARLDPFSIGGVHRPAA
jgi:rubrerythrin